MKLIGSKTSPFVRRIRVINELKDFKCDFEVLDTRSPEGVQRVSSLSSIRRVPLLIDGDSVIFDSLIIAEYLLASIGETLSIQDKMKLKMIDEINDSAVHLFQLKFFGDDPEWKTKFAMNHVKRVEDCFAEVEKDISSYDSDLSIRSIWLYCLIDWIKFRNIFDLDKYSQISNFYKTQSVKDIYIETDPRE
ncbi:glutathione S-transferase family protein [Bacteriovorax sp. Seq25_V]|uniref:glutathione S-transferase family protein n=1 Tax=Bacteriovorax sp. Seq25_V TaxID=1201288 RepID=UPI000389F447|nr:glutathione S-transferase family protein [Bacteriovorax sp. Seq25_V]EQC47976.1 glutathione S-transferase, N-terminal domain protein [Bacteriovorax sp. Seq25_V]